METLHGFGLMVGPFLGGLLYELNGFYFPFAVCGGTLVLCAIFSLCFLENSQSKALHDSGKSISNQANSTQYRQLLKMPSIIASCALLVIAETSVAWYLPTLQPMLESKFGLSPMSTGAMFMVEGLTYALFSPIWGYLLDKRIKVCIPFTVGCLGVLLGYGLLGPAPFLTDVLPSNVYVVGAGLFIQGSCVAATFITSLVFMMNESVAQGAADTEQTVSLNFSGLDFNF